MPAIERLTRTHLEAICRVLVDAVSHRQVDTLMQDCAIKEQGGGARWERMLLALLARQAEDGCANNVIAFIEAVLSPVRFVGRSDDLGEVRRTLNTHLAFCGIEIGEDGKARPVHKARTLSEAEERANELRAELGRRRVHADVLRFCQPEFLQQNYFHCVLEASKSLAQKIRDRTGLAGDGAEIVDAAFSLKAPMLALNSLQTESEQKEQSGFSNLLKGIFGVFRNPTAHAPKIHWAVNRQDAVDALTIISYAHRRVDEAVTVPRAGT
jgi:uncharacterized protein (TIGR02391 family)